MFLVGLMNFVKGVGSPPLSSPQSSPSSSPKKDSPLSLPMRESASNVNQTLKDLKWEDRGRVFLNPAETREGVLFYVGELKRLKTYIKFVQDPKQPASYAEVHEKLIQKTLQDVRRYAERVDLVKSNAKEDQANLLAYLRTQAEELRASWLGGSTFEHDFSYNQGQFGIASHRKQMEELIEKMKGVQSTEIKNQGVQRFPLNMHSDVQQFFDLLQNYAALHERIQIAYEKFKNLQLGDPVGGPENAVFIALQIIERTIYTEELSTLRKTYDELSPRIGNLNYELADWETLAVKHMRILIDKQMDGEIRARIKSLELLLPVNRKEIDISYLTFIKDKAGNDSQLMECQQRAQEYAKLHALLNVDAAFEKVLDVDTKAKLYQFRLQELQKLKEKETEFNTNRSQTYDEIRKKIVEKQDWRQVVELAEALAKEALDKVNALLAQKGLKTIESGSLSML
jgi:hypothetical protein